MGIMLQVDNLAAQVTDDDLIVRFAEFGMVESAAIDRGSDTRQQSACVVMANDQEAQAAIDWLHDTQFKGQAISVRRAASNKQRRFWLHMDVPR